jgi:hypothetical protein
MEVGSINEVEKKFFINRIEITIMGRITIVKIDEHIATGCEYKTIQAASSIILPLAILPKLSDFFFRQGSV